jgi:metal-responsive CopG/Arc/MetJ family transcriptional regulator
MESITIKVDDILNEEISQAMKSGYSTKTEFIREAVRDKIKEIKKDEILEILRNNFGKAKTKTTNAEERKIREKAFQELVKEKGWE